MNHSFQLYLASSSPRRSELLTQIGISYQPLKNGVTEEMLNGESPEDHADRLALAKAQAGWESSDRTADCPVLGADTIVVLNDNILGKPQDLDDFLRMMRMLSGNTHHVITSVALVQNDHIASVTSVSRVTFRDISTHEIKAYWDTREPIDKAGGYGIQGKGAIFVERIEGSQSGIMGLPLYETAVLLAEFGIAVLK